jgi:SRSO17 transposase
MRQKTDSREIRFFEYLHSLARVIGHADRQEPLKSYIKGLCLPGERKSIEPMAAKVDPLHVQAKHQSMHHLVANAPWEDQSLLKISRNYVWDQMERHGGIIAYIVDDTGMKKKGTHSVGVARQYCGNVGKTENCQVAVSLSMANEAISLPVAYQLYLSEAWTDDIKRRRKVSIPDDIGFKKKWQISLEQIARLQNEGIPMAPVLADAGYGDVTEFRDQLTEWEIPYVLAIKKGTTLWAPGKQPMKPIQHTGRGRPATRLRRNKDHYPMDAKTIALNIPKKKWKCIAWREGTKGVMESRFAFIRVRSAHRDNNMTTPRSEEWLIVEWPENEENPTKYWLSTLPKDHTPEQLVKTAKIRWRIERDYEELKGEFGLDHFEGRSWRGFHHHATLCISAYAFMASERARFSPPESLSFLEATPIPAGFRPRGSPA